MAEKQLGEKSGNLIDHRDCAAEILSKLYMDADSADVVFIDGYERFPAHRCVLSASHEYFHAMFYGEFAESTKKEIELNADSSAFGVILKYIYTGLVPISAYDDSLVIETVKLAHFYGMEKLVCALVDKLMERIKDDNVIAIAICAQQLNLTSCSENCLKYIDGRSMEIVRKGLGSLTKDLLCSIISRDEFSVNEMELFNAVKTWGDGQNKKDFKEALSHVRFTLMQVNELKSVVEPLGVLSSNEIVKIINDIRTLDCLPYRKGNHHRNQLDCYDLKYLTEYGYGYRHEWSQTNSYFAFVQTSFVLQLVPESKINHIEMALPHKCSYIIEVSRDRREWTRVVDYSDCSCKGEQDLYLELQPVRFVYVLLKPIGDSKPRLNEIKISYKLCTMPKMDVDGLVAIVSPQNKLTRVFPNIREPQNTMSVLLAQPLYINCLWLKLQSIPRYGVIYIKTALKNSSVFRKVKLKPDHAGECYFFEAHSVSRMEIGLNRNFENNKTITAAVFFNQTNMEELIMANKD